MLLKSIDQLGNTIQINFPPQRIVSLVPSQTEFLFDIGLDAEIVGITRFCIHPAQKVQNKTKIGGTKKFNIERIKSLNPDLIIGNKEENYELGIKELSAHFPVWISDIFSLKDAYSMMRELGRITGKYVEADTLATSIKEQFSSFDTGIVERENERSCAYFIWRKPYMVAGKGTFIDSMLQRCGLENAFRLERYPEVNVETLVNANPDVILLSSEPYPFKEKHINELKAIVPHAKIKLVDGELFSWYGSRLLHAPKYFEQLINDLKSV